jgi:hypothetical protein
MSTTPYEGVTCDFNNIGQFFNAYGNINQSPVSNLFFAPSNIAYLQKQLERVLTFLVNETVKVPVNEEFMQSMYDVYSQNGGLAYLNQYGLDQLNENLIEWEARIQYVSIRQQKRYDDWILKENRVLTFPYPEPTKSLKGETVISTSGYMLTNPWKNNFGNALETIYHIGPRATPPCPSNNFPTCPSSPVTRT